MTEPSPTEPIIDRIRSWARTKALRGPRSAFGTAAPSILPVTEQTDDSSGTVVASSSKSWTNTNSHGNISAVFGTTTTSAAVKGDDNSGTDVVARCSPRHPNTAHARAAETDGKNGHHGPALATSEAAGKGPFIGLKTAPPDADHTLREQDAVVSHDASPMEDRQESRVHDARGSSENPQVVSGDEKSKPTSPGILKHIYLTVRMILFRSWLNVLLIFVPVGIIAKVVPSIPPAVVFATNCIAIVPLAGLLSQATETVAAKLGDTVGALLNITFGNAVELIIL